MILCKKGLNLVAANKDTIKITQIASRDDTGELEILFDVLRGLSERTDINELFLKEGISFEIRPTGGNNKPL